MAGSCTSQQQAGWPHTTTDSVPNTLALDPLHASGTLSDPSCLQVPTISQAIMYRWLVRRDERLSTRVCKFSRLLQPTATLVQDSATSAERAPLFDKAVFRKATVLQSAVIFKNFDTLRSCFSVQALCFCIVFLDHVKHLQIHATGAALHIGRVYVWAGPAMSIARIPLFPGERAWRDFFKIARRRRGENKSLPISPLLRHTRVMAEITESSAEYVQTVGRSEVLPQDWTGHVSALCSLRNRVTHVVYS